MTQGYGRIGLTHSDVRRCIFLLPSYKRLQNYTQMFPSSRTFGAIATVHMTGGPLAGRVAHVPKGPNGRAALQFVRAENEVNGKPTIDVSSTSCYLGQK